MSMTHEAFVDCGWGRLIFGQTFRRAGGAGRERSAMKSSGERDIVLYAREPHVVLAEAPQLLFLDPSHTYRLDFLQPRPVARQGPAGRNLDPAGRPKRTPKKSTGFTCSRGMVPLRDGYLADGGTAPSVCLLVAESSEGGLAGVVMGVDHTVAFNDPDNGSSLWALGGRSAGARARCRHRAGAGAGRKFPEAGRAFMDLSVKHDNVQAIALYEKLGFTRVPVFCVKRKNAVNETLFVGPAINGELNIYARIIVDEARRRGIAVEVEDAEAGLFRLSFGGRAVACRESLSDMTSAVALSRCDDKALTRRAAGQGGLAGARTAPSHELRRKRRRFWSGMAMSWSSRRAASKAAASSSISQPRTKSRAPSSRRG